MKYVLIILLTLSLSACANAKKASKVKALILTEASSKTSTKGKETTDGKSSSTNYSFIFEKPESVKFEKVWIYQTAYEFTEFDNEGAYYVSVQMFSGNRENVLMDKMPIESRAEAVIQYKDGEVTKYLEVVKITSKDPTFGK